MFRDLESDARMVLESMSYKANQAFSALCDPAMKRKWLSIQDWSKLGSFQVKSLKMWVKEFLGHDVVNEKKSNGVLRYQVAFTDDDVRQRVCAWVVERKNK